MSRYKIKLFLSYAHDDEGDSGDVTEFLTELNKCLKASKHFDYQLWADRDLLIGDQWHEKITGSLAECDYGLMLVSLSFITSDYIREYELPPLLNSGRALPVGFQKIDLQWFDTKGIAPKQVFYHQNKFYNEFATNTQGRSDFVQELVKAIEIRFLQRDQRQFADQQPAASTPAIKDEASTSDPEQTTEAATIKELVQPIKKDGIFNNRNLLFAGGLLLFLGGLVYAALFLLSQPKTNEPVMLENNLVLQPIPSGDFKMGGQLGSHANAEPVHPVKFASPFWMSATEVTFAQYDAYAQEQQLNLPNDEGWGRGQHPVINVSWHGARAYAGWLSKHNAKGLNCRLPSEAEWEYAARAGSQVLYSWGERVGKNKAHCLGCGSEWDGKLQSVPIASFAPNLFGLYDMHGNVAEWVADSWHDNYWGAPRDGSVWQSGGNEERRVVRGGSWGDGPDEIHSAHRIRIEPDSLNNSIGFRVVCELPD